MASLSRERQYAINHAVVGDQAPVGTILAALQNGVVGPVPGTYGAGFAPGALGAGALNLATVTATTDATAGTTTTVTYTVPGAPATFSGAVWTAGNGYLAVTASSPGYSYASGTLTITVASAAASQTLTVYILNG